MIYDLNSIQIINSIFVKLNKSGIKQLWSIKHYTQTDWFVNIQAYPTIQVLRGGFPRCPGARGRAGYEGVETETLVSGRSPLILTHPTSRGLLNANRHPSFFISSTSHIYLFLAIIKSNPLYCNSILLHNSVNIQCCQYTW